MLSSTYHESCFSFKRVPFTPNQPLVDLALVGLSGTKGWLHVVVQSEVEGQNIDLLLPFQLAQCPMGYYDPPGASTVDEVMIACY